MSVSLVMTGASPDELWPLVRDFHYSKRAPATVHYAFGWREPGGLFGDTGELHAGVSYSQPVNRHFPTCALELSRLVRRDDFVRPLSPFVAWSLRWLRSSTETPFVLSYADSAQGHHGGIYQACGFVYVGERGVPFDGIAGFRDPNGAFVHARTCNARYGTHKADFILDRHPDWSIEAAEPKHLYIFPLRQKWATIARQHGWAAQPYPKPHAARLLDASGSPACEPGANPGGRSIDKEAA